MPGGVFVNEDELLGGDGDAGVARQGEGGVRDGARIPVRARAIVIKGRSCIEHVWGDDWCDERPSGVSRLASLLTVPAGLC